MEIIAALVMATIAGVCQALGHPDAIDDAMLVASATGLATWVVASEVRCWISLPNVTFPTLGMAYLMGSYVFQFVGTIPSLYDDSFLLWNGGSLYTPLAMTYVAISMLAYRIAFRGGPPFPVRGLPLASPAIHRMLMVATVLILSGIYLVRSMQIATGHFFYWGTYKATVSVASTSIYFSIFTIMWVIIPLAEYMRSQSPGKTTRALWTAISVAEILFGLLQNSRTTVVLTTIQLLICRAVFSSKGWGWLFRRSMGLVVIFFFILVPSLTLMRKELGYLEGYELKIGDYIGLLTESTERLWEGEDAELRGEVMEMDTKYRLNSTYYITSLMAGASNPSVEYGMGMYTVRNFAAVFPRLLWPNKDDFAIPLMKAVVPLDFGIPRVDYAQSIYAHFFAEFGWFGIIALWVTGLFDRWLTNRFSSATSHFALFWMLCLTPTWLFPVQDAAGHFVFSFRESGLVFGVLILIERTIRKAPESQLSAAMSSQGLVFGSDLSRPH